MRDGRDARGWRARVKLLSAGQAHGIVEQITKRRVGILLLRLPDLLRIEIVLCKRRAKKLGIIGFMLNYDCAPSQTQS
jgi:hypothetical protein